MKKILPLCMFLLIFSPKIAGKIDSLSIFSILIFIRAISEIRKNVIPKRIIKPTMIYLLFGFIMMVYVSLLISFYGLTDYYQLLRFGRIIVNVLGAFGLAILYYSYYKTDYSKMLLYHLWLCLIFHAILMILMFIFPPVNHFVITQLVQMDEANRSFDTRFAGQRIGGLTSTWDATSGIQSLGILLLPFIFEYFGDSSKKRRLFYISIPISLTAIVISGVTGFVIMSIIGIVLILPRLIKVSEIFKYLTGAFFLCLLGIGALQYLSANNPELVQNTSIGRTTYMITGNASNYNQSNRLKTAGGTVERIFSDMYFFPDDQVTFLFGRGGSGRSSDYIIKADPGLVLNFHNLGVFFVLVLYTYCVTMIVMAFKLSKYDLYAGLAICAILSTILIIDLKVMYLLARNSLSIMLIAYFALYSYKNKYLFAE